MKYAWRLEAKIWQKFKILSLSEVRWDCGRRLLMQYKGIATYDAVIV